MEKVLREYTTNLKLLVVAVAERTNNVQVAKCFGGGKSNARNLQNHTFTSFNLLHL